VFLAKRVERRQAETLIHEIEAQDAVIAGRRSQQALDDWYLNRLQATKNPQNFSKPPRSSDLPDGTDRAANKT
jgi:hypothetical protein